MDEPRPHSRALPDFEALLARHYPDCEPVAVIGHACRFPESDDSEAFWRNLVDGRECSRRFSRQELLDAGMPAETVDAPNFVPVGTVVPDADAFDAGLFGYSRQEAESIDPQQRLFLQIVWHALEHAGYAPRSVPHKTGVFGSARISTYPGREPLRIAEVAQVRGLQSLMGNDKDYLSSRAAYKLDLRGPAISVQTACSSSLVAVHMACESLRAGECDMAVAGGVAVSFPQQAGYLHQPGMIFSPDGRCRPFDAEAQGTFAGNGVGAVVLRRLADALRDGDPITAVVLGSALNNDGAQKVGYTAPSVAGQRDVIREAMSLAGVVSGQVGLVEAHGTATPLGDPIEVEALRAVFHRRGDGPPCALGSVKSNLGHLDTAAGIASLLKAALAVERATIPPSLHFHQPNPALRLDDSPFHVPTQAQPWTAPVRLAGVSSFGIGGTNCHLIVASLPDELWAASAEAGARPDDAASGMGALLLSAASESALRGLAGAYAQALHGSPPADLACTTLHGRHLDLEFRLAVPLCEETAAALTACATGEDDVLVHLGRGEPGRQAWLFTGQGSHWHGMGKTLHMQSPAFAACLDRCLAACESGDTQPLDPPLREVMLGDRGDLLERMEYAQPAIVAFELAMAAHWESLGLKPDLVLGHSVGEFAAAAVVGHYDVEPVMRLVRRRGALMDRCAGGAMLSAFADEAASLPVARRHGVDLAAWNGERHLVFSGENHAIETLAAALDEQGIRCNRLAVAGAAHSRLLDPILDEFQREAAALQAKPGRVPLISTLTGERIDADGLDAPDHWRRHMREPVRFIQALRTAIAQGVGLFLELGPDAPLTGIGLREAPGAAKWIASTRRHQPAMAQLEQALLQLYAAGVELPWKSLLPANGRRIHAPLYPFDTERYWREAQSAATALPCAASDEAMESGRRVAAQAGQELDLPRLQALYACVTRLHAIYVDALVRHCVGARIESGVTALEVLRGGRLLPRHRQLLVRLLDACVEDGYYRRDGERYAAAGSVPSDSRAALLDELRGYCEGLDVIAETVARAGENLYAMMSGQEEPVAIIFPEGASGGVEVLYQDFSFGRYFNRIAAGTVAGLMRERQAQHRRHAPFRILEVGGGTGGTTAWLLPELADQPEVRYDFTDISAIFTRRAEAKFADYDFLTYRELDLQKDARSQGFEAGGYDLIVAANVIHATQHVGRTLANLYPLLKPGGRLLMREITRPMRLFDFVFGPLVPPLHDSEARGGELFLTTARWREQCLAAGFERVDWLPDDGTPTSDISEHIVLATAPGRPAAATLPWLVGSSDDPLGQPLTDDGCYLADWSDCVGREDRWQQRIREACAELSRRHGNGRNVTPSSLPAAPERISLVRLRWQAAPFGASHAVIECRVTDGVWRTEVISTPSHGLPVPSPAPGTHYDWQWSPATGSTAIEGAVALRGDVLDAEAVLQAAGLQVQDRAEQTLLLLDLDHDDPLAVADELLAALADETPELVVVTRSAWRILSGEHVRVAHHAAWGLLRAAAAEQPARKIAAVDLGERVAWEELLTGLAAVHAGHRWIAVREGRALVPRLAVQVHAAPALPPDAMAGAGWHLVTGGFGGLGRLGAQWLAVRGARRIALLAPRTHADWADFQRMMNERHGCELHWQRCDVGDPDQLAAALSALQADGGIAGAIHTAGLLDDTPLASLDRTRLAPLFAVKALAAQTLYAWLSKHQSRYLLLYSSAAASLGAAGQCGHAFASAWLDGLALAHADAQPTVISIAWGAWGETGRAADTDLQGRLAAEGMGVLASAEGLWHLEQAVMRGAPWRLAMRVRPDRLDAVRRELLAAAPGEQTTAPKPSRADRTALALPAPSAEELHDLAAVAAWLTARIASQLRLDDPARLSPQRDLVQLGLDSLLFLELSSDIQRRLGVRLDAERAYRDFTVAGLSRLIVEAAPQVGERRMPDTLQHDVAGRHLPFPLTPIQHAYWLGRTELIEYGGVACHVLFEWDKRHDEFDLERFEHAWNALIQRHDMLRMVVDADGQQRVLPQVPAYRIERRDLRALSPQRQARALEEARRELSARVLPADRWPLFELVASELDAQRYRLHMNLDLLMFDVQSFKVMMDDLALAYRGEELASLPITFRDYVLADQALRQEETWRASWRYWQERLAELPPAPDLPLAATRPHTRPRFTTYQARLDKEAWAGLRREWQAWGATPSAALLTLFAHTLERWSRQPHFTLNLTFFDRRPVHPQVRQLIGDFTSVLLIDFDLGRPCTLRESIERTQRLLWQRLAHSQVNGVELMRELGRSQQRHGQSLMPVVFTSMLGMSLDGLAIDQAMTSLLGDPVHVFTQTPQVWLDHQVMEIDGELVFSWYCMDDVLAEGAAQAMFDDYHAVLRAVAAQPDLMNRADLVKLHGDGALEPFARRPWPYRGNGPDIDLRDIEDALRTRGDVRQAEAMPGEDGNSLRVRVVAAADHTFAVASSPLCAADALKLPHARELEQFESAWQWLEARALRGIADTLRRRGLFEHVGQTHDFDAVLVGLGAVPQHRRLVRQWLQLLSDRSWLQREGEAYACLRPLTQIPDAVASLPDAAWCRTIADFLEACIARHEALLDGTQSPLELMFADGAPVANAFYGDNPVAQCLHRNAARVAGLLGEGTDGLRVLEVGAGVGATTHHLLPALEGRLRSYRFTDVSTLFLDDARTRFGHVPQLDYGLLDIDRPIDFDAHPETGYDLIIAGQVMHDASHVVRALRRLGLLLRPSGRLLLIEATERDSALQLASVGFIESLGGYEDVRTLDDKAMLDLPMWRTALEQAGFGVELAWPGEDRTPLRQHLILARAERVGRLPKRDIEQDLQARFGGILPPVRVQQCERLDMDTRTAPTQVRPDAATPPAEIDRRARSRNEDDGAQRAALERQVAAVWQELLARPVQRDSDFFQSGGDSLIATRMIARLNRQGLGGASLQGLFAHPSLAEFCATLEIPIDAAGAQGLVIPLAMGSGAGSTFLFHASDGELGAYLPLARHLDTEVFGLQAPEPLTADSLTALAGGYVDAIRRQRPQGPYVLIGWSYGTFVAAEAARLLHRDGAQVLLSLLDPVCRADFAFSDRAALLRLIAEGRVRVPLPENLERLDPDEQVACFASGAAAVGLLPSEPDAARAQAWIDRIAHLLDLLARHPEPEPVSVPCLWLGARRRPAHWAPAEDDWSAWVPHAEHHTLDADHWQLVMDETTAARAAEQIRRWQQRHTGTARKEQIA